MNSLWVQMGKNKGFLWKVDRKDFKSLLKEKSNDNKHKHTHTCTYSAASKANKYGSTTKQSQWKGLWKLRTHLCMLNG